MRQVKLGKSELNVSRICLGCMSYGDPNAGQHTWVLNEEESRPFIKRSLEKGINFFDTANVYSYGASEEVLGRAIRDFAKRDEVVIATKVYSPMIKGDPKSGGLSRAAIVREFEASLKRLKMDYVDLLQIHRWDYDVPIEETLAALHDIVKAGKARYIGASSMHAWQFTKSLYLADLHGWTRFISMQPHYNLINREEEREMLPLCLSENIGVLPWSPLARGRLARPFKSEPTKRGQSDAFGKTLYQATEEADRLVIEKVSAIALSRGVPESQIALAWLLSKPVVTAPIVGATQLRHLDAAIEAEALKLTSEEIRLLEEPYVPHTIAGFS